MKFYFVDVIHVYEGRKGEIESSQLYIFDTLDIELVGRRQRIACL